MFCDNHNTIQLNIIHPLQMILDTPMPRVGKPTFFNKNFKINTMNDPANPPANNENPKNNITLAAQAFELPLDKKLAELLGSLNKLDFSMEFTIIIPKVEQM